MVSTLSFQSQLSILCRTLLNVASPAAHFIGIIAVVSLMLAVNVCISVGWRLGSVSTLSGGLLNCLMLMLGPAAPAMSLSTMVELTEHSLPVRLSGASLYVVEIVVVYFLLNKFFYTFIRSAFESAADRRKTCHSCGLCTTCTTCDEHKTCVRGNICQVCATCHVPGVDGHRNIGLICGPTSCGPSTQICRHRKTRCADTFPGSTNQRSVKSTVPHGSCSGNLNHHFSERRGFAYSYVSSSFEHLSRDLGRSTTPRSFCSTCETCVTCRPSHTCKLCHVCKDCQVVNPTSITTDLRTWVLPDLRRALTWWRPASDPMSASLLVSSRSCGPYGGIVQLPGASVLAKTCTSSLTNAKLARLLDEQLLAADTPEGDLDIPSLRRSLRHRLLVRSSAGMHTQQARGHDKTDHVALTTLTSIPLVTHVHDQRSLGVLLGHASKQPLHPPQSANPSTSDSVVRSRSGGWRSSGAPVSARLLEQVERSQYAPPCPELSGQMTSASTNLDTLNVARVMMAMLGAATPAAGSAGMVVHGAASLLRLPAESGVKFDGEKIAAALSGVTTSTGSFRIRALLAIAAELRVQEERPMPPLPTTASVEATLTPQSIARASAGDLDPDICTALQRAVKETQQWQDGVASWQAVAAAQTRGMLVSNNQLLLLLGGEPIALDSSQPRSRLVVAMPAHNGNNLRDRHTAAVSHSFRLSVLPSSAFEPLPQLKRPTCSPQNHSTPSTQGTHSLHQLPGLSSLGRAIISLQVGLRSSLKGRTSNAVAPSDSPPNRFRSAGSMRGASSAAAGNSMSGADGSSVDDYSINSSFRQGSSCSLPTLTAASAHFAAGCGSKLPGPLLSGASAVNDRQGSSLPGPTSAVSAGKVEGGAAHAQGSSSGAPPSLGRLTAVRPIGKLFRDKSGAALSIESVRGVVGTHGVLDLAQNSCLLSCGVMGAASASDADRAATGGWVGGTLSRVLTLTPSAELRGLGSSEAVDPLHHPGQLLPRQHLHSDLESSHPPTTPPELQQRSLSHETSPDSSLLPTIAAEATAANTTMAMSHGWSMPGRIKGALLLMTPRSPPRLYDGRPHDASASCSQKQATAATPFELSPPHQQRGFNGHLVPSPSSAATSQHTPHPGGITSRGLPTPGVAGPVRSLSHLGLEPEEALDGVAVVLPQLRGSGGGFASRADALTARGLGQELVTNDGGNTHQGEIVEQKMDGGAYQKDVVARKRHSFLLQP